MRRQFVIRQAQLARGSGLEGKGGIRPPGTGMDHALADDPLAAGKLDAADAFPTEDADDPAGIGRAGQRQTQPAKPRGDGIERARADEEGALVRRDGPILEQPHRCRQIHHPRQIGAGHQRREGAPAGGENDLRRLDHRRRPAVMRGGEEKPAAAIERHRFPAGKQADARG